MQDELTTFHPTATVPMLSSLPEDTTDVYVRVGGDKPPLAIASLPSQNRTSMRRGFVPRPTERIIEVANEYANEVWRESCDCDFEDLEEADPQDDCECGAWDRAYDWYMQEGQWEDFPDEEEDEEGVDGDETDYYLRNPLIVWGGDPCTTRSPYRYLMSIDGLEDDENVVAPGTPNMYRGGDACLGGNFSPQSHLEAWEAYWNSYHNNDLNQPVNLPDVPHPELAKEITDISESREPHKLAALEQMRGWPDDNMTRMLRGYLDGTLSTHLKARVEEAIVTGTIPSTWEDEAVYDWCRTLRHEQFGTNNVRPLARTDERHREILRLEAAYTRCRNGWRRYAETPDAQLPVNQFKQDILRSITRSFEQRYNKAVLTGRTQHPSVADMRSCLAYLAHRYTNAHSEEVWALFGLSNDITANENSVMGLSSMQRLFGGGYENQYYRMLDGYYGVIDEDRHLVRLSNRLIQVRNRISNEDGTLSIQKLIALYLSRIPPAALEVFNDAHDGVEFAFFHWFHQLARTGATRPRWTTVWRSIRNWRFGSPGFDPRVDQVRNNYRNLHPYAGHRPYQADWTFEELTHIEPHANLCLLGLRSEDRIGTQSIDEHLKLWHFGSGMLRGLIEAGADPDDVAQFYHLDERNSSIHQRTISSPAKGLGTVIPCLRQGDTLFTQCGARMYRGRIVYNGSIPPRRYDSPGGYDVIARRIPIVIIWGDITPTES